MIICANCRQYTDDAQPTCTQCGAPLREHDRSDLTRFMRLDEGVAKLAADQERAHLIPSGVLVRSLPEFFFQSEQRQTVLVDLFGGPRTPRRSASAVLFASVVYLIEHGYCKLLPLDAEQVAWASLKPWDGQMHCMETLLAARAEDPVLALRPEYTFTLRRALDQTIREAMGFRYKFTNQPLVRVPGAPKTPPVIDSSTRSAFNGVLEMSRQAAMPDHDPKAANAEVYRMLLTFTRTFPQDTRSIVDGIEKTLDWFVAYEKDPSIALLRD